MKNLQIDFAQQIKRYPAWVRLGLLVLGAVSLAALMTLTKQINAQMTIQQHAVLAKQNQTPLAKPNAQFSATLQAAMKTQQHLNAPWLESLSMLEQAQMNHQDIALLSATPNAAKAEITLVGEAQQFDDISLFLTDLKSQPMVADAVLQNQQLFETETGKQVVQFNVVLTWKMTEKWVM